MEKRLMLAIALSFLVAWTWSSLTPKPAPVVQPDLVVGKIPALAQPTIKIPELPGTKFSLDNFDIEIIEPLATIKEIKFKKYNNDNLLLIQGLYINDPSLNFKKLIESKNELTFVHEDENKIIYKRFIFSNYNYSIELEIEIENLSGNDLDYALPMTLGVMDSTLEPGQTQFHDIYLGTSEKSVHLNARKTGSFEDIKFIGLRNRYFCAVIEPASDKYAGKISKVSASAFEASVLSPEIRIPAKQKNTQKFLIYLGPQDLGLIKGVNPEWAGIIYYGMFDLIAQVMVQFIIWINHIFHNWGVAIIILTILVQTALYPLTLKQIRSMKEMQAVQPKVEELRKVYKDNPQKMNKEIMELYREHKVNPFGGCLPMLLQMPIFIALFQMQNRFILLKNAPFLWIKDLSQPDKLFTIPGALPLLGKDFSLNILPLFAVAMMFFQQKFTMPKVGGEGAEQQKIMSIMFPIMMLLFFYNASAAFNLYMLVNFGFMLGQTLVGKNYGIKKEH